MKYSAMRPKLRHKQIGGIMSIQVFENMLNQEMVSVVGAPGDDEMVFKAANGKTFTFYHEQDCCEGVNIEDVCGDINDLVGSPILYAEEVDNVDNVPDLENGDWRYESYTWTFYKFGTAKGSVTVRWLGSSNGYYSESVTYRES
jgi:hypothetical protein